MTELTDLQARLLAGRAVRAVREQEEEARALRPVADLPSQRPPVETTVLTLVVDADADADEGR